MWSAWAVCICLCKDNGNDEWRWFIHLYMRDLWSYYYWMSVTAVVDGITRYPEKAHKG